jgi:thiamine-phosphate pyrophosphorylase
MIKRRKIDYSLYLVADTEFVGGRDLVPMVLEAVLGGVSIVQLRAKNLGTRDFLHLALRLSDLLCGLRVPLLINDRTDIALACGADGAHLGQDDLPADAARGLLGKSKIIGISVNTIEEAQEAERLGADYVGLGPIYATNTKDTELPVLGPEGIRRMSRRIGIPIIAIAGINAANAVDVMKAGAAGIAVVSAVLGAVDIRSAAGCLKKSIHL